MKTFAHNFIWLISILAVMYVGYWGFSQLMVSAPEQYVQKDATPESVRIEPVATVVVSDTKKEVEEIAIETIPSETEEPKSTNPQHAELVAELQKLVTDGVFMKVGSRGTRVGTIQKFLNIYEGTSKKIDNDYGGGTKTGVSSFQKTAGLSVDGETGPNTYKAMIAWLGKS